jgi:Transcription factor WhiB
MTNGMQAPTRRTVILEHLGQDPGRGLTGYELARTMGCTIGSLSKLLASMERHAQVVAATEWRQGIGRQVSLWRIAPPGTVPPPAVPLPPERLAARRERDREAQRRRRAWLHGEASPSPCPLVLPPGAACACEDPELFFPASAEDEAKAKAICADCPIRRECYAAAVASGQEFGIWSGVNFEAVRGDTR